MILIFVLKKLSHTSKGNIEAEFCRHPCIIFLFSHMIKEMVKLNFVQILVLLLLLFSHMKKEILELRRCL